MSKKVANRIIRGSFGTAWLNNEKLYEVRSLEAKVSLTYEELHLNGEFGTRRRYMGFDISGTVVLHKVSSRVPKLMGAGPKTGQLPAIKLDVALRDPDVKGAQRIVLDDVTLDEFTLAQFENNTVLEESVPFHAADYDVPEWLADLMM